MLVRVTAAGPAHLARGAVEAPRGLEADRRRPQGSCEVLCERPTGDGSTAGLEASRVLAGNRTWRSGLSQERLITRSTVAMKERKIAVGLDGIDISPCPCRVAL